MVPSYSRQLLVFSLPTFAVLLSYFWYRRKRNPQKETDPGDFLSSRRNLSLETERKEDFAEQSDDSGSTTPCGTPDKKLVLSTPSTPIDIIIPRELRSLKTSPQVISDEDLDLEIEKIKSMRNGSGGSSESIKLNSRTDTDNKRRCSSESLNKLQKQKPSVEEATSFAVDDKTVCKKGASDVKMPKNKEVDNKKSPAKMIQKERTAATKRGSLNSTKGLPASKKEDVVDGNIVNNITNNGNNNAENEEIQMQNSERDSANHSPADVMLASPSLSCISDNHSEGSSDSGKGGSEVATPPSRTPAGDGTERQIYEFLLPQALVGKLIGKFGKRINDIKRETNTYIEVRDHPDVGNKQTVCVIQGRQCDIEKALSKIRQVFPAKRHPDITLEPITLCAPVNNVPLPPDYVYCKLIEGINNDTVVSCMVTPAHLFLQQPAHPSYPHLQMLTNYLEICYNVPGTPVLPKPILENTVCVALSVGQWYRVLILSSDIENDKSYVTFLDYGGYANIANADLRQIRGDFLMLPFQAAECILYNIQPVGGPDAEWNPEAYNLVAELTKGTIALTQIADYTENGIPLVLMYIIVGPQEVVLLNSELVNAGFAEYCNPPVREYLEGSTTSGDSGTQCARSIQQNEAESVDDLEAA